jgi:hypothetical protein
MNSKLLSLIQSVNVSQLITASLFSSLWWWYCLCRFSLRTLGSKENFHYFLLAIHIPPNLTLIKMYRNTLHAPSCRKIMSSCFYTHERIPKQIYFTNPMRPKYCFVSSGSGKADRRAHRPCNSAGWARTSNLQTLAPSLTLYTIVAHPHMWSEPNYKFI